MRERLLAAFVGITLLTVLLYAVPRAFIRAEAARNEVQREVSLTAASAASLVSARQEARLPLSGTSVPVLSDWDRVVLRQGSATLLLAGLPSPASGTPVVARRVLPGIGTIEATRAEAAVTDRVHEEVGQIALAAAGSLIAAIVAAFLLSGRLVRPFRRLATAAAELGTGGELDLPPQRVREVEAIASALRSSQVHQEALLRSERDFARNVSHQLRTPLTGMRLSVEGLLLDDHDERTRADLESVLREIDRLADTVTALLAFARQGNLGTSRQVTVAELLASAVQRWSRLAEEQGRALELVPPAADRLAQVPVVVADQVLDVLVHNALTHGSGAVRLEGECGQRTVVLRVRDEGSLGEVPEAELLGRKGSTAGGEGIGLALSASLADVTGGSLRVVDREPTCFELRLPLQP